MRQWRLMRTTGGPGRARSWCASLRSDRRPKVASPTTSTGRCMSPRRMSACGNTPPSPTAATRAARSTRPMMRAGSPTTSRAWRCINGPNGSGLPGRVQPGRRTTMPCTAGTATTSSSVSSTSSRMPRRHRRSFRNGRARCLVGGARQRFPRRAAGRAGWAQHRARGTAELQVCVVGRRRSGAQYRLVRPTAMSLVPALVNLRRRKDRS